jgi:hypothetical protein
MPSADAFALRRSGLNEFLFAPLAMRAISQSRSASRTNRRRPPIGFAEVEPVCRSRLTQRITVDSPSPSNRATARQDCPSLTSATARSRKSSEYGRVIHSWPPPSQQFESDNSPRRNPPESVRSGHALGARNASGSRGRRRERRLAASSIAAPDRLTAPAGGETQLTAPAGGETHRAQTTEASAEHSQ